MKHLVSGILSAALLMPAGVSIATDGASEPQVKAGFQAFEFRCESCHTTAHDGPDKLGPNLFGIVGRKSGARPGFEYSPALAGGKIVWDEAALERFLSAPRDAVPGTLMIFSGLSQAEERAAIIAFLKRNSVSAKK